MPKEGSIFEVEVVVGVGVVGMASGWELSVTVLVFVVVGVAVDIKVGKGIATAAAATALSIIELTGRLSVSLRFPLFKRGLNLAKSSSSVAIFFFPNPFSLSLWKMKMGTWILMTVIHHPRRLPSHPKA